MSKKILTQELIEQKLADKGYPLTHGEGMTYEFMLKKVCDYYDAEISEDWNDNADFFIYSETTADGYEVYIATNSPSTPSINEDVYYYDSDLASSLEDALIDGARIYVDYLQDDYVHEAAESAYDYLYDQLLEETENELIDEGYEYEEETEVA
jgi:hypothetical protein